MNLSSIRSRIQRALRDTVGHQTNVMRYCPYPAQRHRAVLMIAPLMLMVLPFVVAKIAFLALGATLLGAFQFVREVVVEVPRELIAAWTGEDTMSWSRWEAYEDFRAERTAKEAIGA